MSRRDETSLKGTNDASLIIDYSCVTRYHSLFMPILPQQGRRFSSWASGHAELLFCPLNRAISPMAQGSDLSSKSLVLVGCGAPWNGVLFPVEYYTTFVI